MAEPRTPLRGEIWILDFSPGRGSEQRGKRPALVVQNDSGNRSARYPNTIVLAMSSKGRPVPFHVRLAPNRENGLRSVSFVKCEQILTVSKSRLENSLGKISAQELKEVEKGVKASLALP